MSRPALGRGLDALIPAGRDPSAVRELPLDAIEPNPQQPRRSFATEQGSELAQSIREHGILQPLLVRPIAGGRYQLVAGERRWRAAELANLERVPVVVINAPDRDMLTLALVENLQREDLNPIDRAAAFQYLLDNGLTQGQVAERLGKSRSAVANAVRLLQLPATLQAQLSEGRLSEGQARAVLAAPVEAWESLAEAAVSAQLSVREVEQEARRLRALAAEGSGAAGGENSADANADAVAAARRADREAWQRWRGQAAEQLQRALGTKVSVSREGEAGGRISLRWSSFEQLVDLVQRLSAAPKSSAEPQPESEPPGRITA